jgi:hypothetical protein
VNPFERHGSRARRAFRGGAANERRARHHCAEAEQSRNQEGTSPHGQNVNRSLLSWNEESVEKPLRA